MYVFFMSHFDSLATLEKFGYLPESLLSGSSKPVVFKCEFCLSSFVSSFKSVGRTASISCSKCRSISASYTQSSSVCNKHEFYLSKKLVVPNSVDDSLTISKFGYSVRDLGSNSKRKVVAKCDFCQSMFSTSLSVLTRNSGVTACKKCDAVASHYSRLKLNTDKHEFWNSMKLGVDFSFIDIDSTKLKFGYDPTGLSPYTVKKVISICSYCKDKLEMTMSKYSSKKGNIACKKCMRRKTVKTLKTRYGVENTLDIPSVKEKLTNPLTEQIIETMLASVYKIEAYRNHMIGPYSFDFFIPSCNLLIECQGDFFHDFKNNGYSGTIKDRTKSSYIENNTSYKLIWIWEHEIHIGRVKKILDFHIRGAQEPDLIFDLKSLSFRLIQNLDAHVFLSQFHYLGNLGTVATCFGAYFNDTLVAVCAFGGVTRQQSIRKVNSKVGSNFGPKQLKELRRFCIRPNVKVKNTASFCLKKFIDLYKKSFSDVCAILSFSDSTVGDNGTIYKASNWINLMNTGESYHYVDLVTNRRIHKKTVWDLAKRSHESEFSFASNSNLEMVKEEPKKVWLKLLT